ncbi:hypothetical protein ZWY2020_020961 [Hordeum vulgare]|nr:hypothetical protein ZWY2020_020961 [Hordeum vulgare]
MSKFVTRSPARNFDVSPMLDDATYAIHDACDDALLDTALPLGAFLDAQIAETAEIIEVEPAISPVRTSSPRYELPDIPEGYVMEGEIAEDFLAYMLKMSLYAKYMKDIVTNKRRIPEVEISAMLANYTFKGGTPKKLDFVILDIPKDDAMAVILGRPFLNTAGAVIDCNKGNRKKKEEMRRFLRGSSSRDPKDDENEKKKPKYIIMPSDIYTYWGIEPPEAPVPELPVEYQTPVYQWEPEELTQQWHPQSTPEYRGDGYFPPWE